MSAFTDLSVMIPVSNEQESLKQHVMGILLTCGPADLREVLFESLKGRCCSRARRRV